MFLQLTQYVFFSITKRTRFLTFCFKKAIFGPNISLTIFKENMLTLITVFSKINKSINGNSHHSYLTTILPSLILPNKSKIQQPLKGNFRSNKSSTGLTIVNKMTFFNLLTQIRLLTVILWLRNSQKKNLCRTMSLKKLEHLIITFRMVFQLQH